MREKGTGFNRPQLSVELENAIMSIRIQENRAVIDETFLEAHKDICAARLGSMITAIARHQTKPSIQAGYKTQFSRPIHRLKAIIKNEASLRSGVDYEITRLRALPYVSYFLVTPDNLPDSPLSEAKLDWSVEWLVGHTQPITTWDMVYNRRTSPFSLGPYWVCFPVRSLMIGAIDGFAAIPEHDPSALARHPHHSVDPRHGDWCWGEFANIVVGLTAEGDIPGLFGIMHAFLTRYYSDSVLVHIYALDFARGLPL